jgi:hypothetical protein
MWLDYDSEGSGTLKVTWGDPEDPLNVIYNVTLHPEPAPILALPTKED